MTHKQRDDIRLELTKAVLPVVTQLTFNDAFVLEQVGSGLKKEDIAARVAVTIASKALEALETKAEIEQSEEEE